MREADEEDSRKRAELQYTKHVESIRCREKRPRPPVEEEYPDDEVLVGAIEYEEDTDYVQPGEEPAKRVRSFSKDVDANWYVEGRSEGNTTWVPVLYSWQKKMNALDGAEDEFRSGDCFGCALLSVDAHEGMYADDWRRVVEFYQAALLQFPDAQQLGKELYHVFDRTVQESLRRNNELGEHETLWTPYGILEHFTKHNKDPVVQHTRNYMALTEIKEVIVNNEMFEENVDTARRRVSDKALKKLETVMKMLDKITSTNPYQLPFASKEVAKSSSERLPFLNSHARLKQRPNFADVHSMWNR